MMEHHGLNAYLAVNISYAVISGRVGRLAFKTPALASLSVLWSTTDMVWPLLISDIYTRYLADT
jgi:hypothetical protein